LYCIVSLSSCFMSCRFVLFCFVLHADSTFFFLFFSSFYSSCHFSYLFSLSNFFLALFSSFLLFSHQDEQQKEIYTKLLLEEEKAKNSQLTISLETANERIKTFEEVNYLLYFFLFLCCLLIC
jgi:hypothetical protein